MKKLTNEKILDRFESEDLEKFVKSYIKSDFDVLKAYKSTFDKHLWRTDANAKIRSKALLEKIECTKIFDEKLDNLRSIYKEEIANSFNVLNKMIKEDTYEHYDAILDVKTGKAIPVKYKKSIPLTTKVKATEIMLKVAGYFDTETNNVIIQHNEYEIVKKMIKDEQK